MLSWRKQLMSSCTGVRLRLAIWELSGADDSSWNNTIWTNLNLILRMESYLVMHLTVVLIVFWILRLTGSWKLVRWHSMKLYLAQSLFLSLWINYAGTDEFLSEHQHFGDKFWSNSWLEISRLSTVLDPKEVRLYPSHLVFPTFV